MMLHNLGQPARRRMCVGIVRVPVSMRVRMRRMIVRVTTSGVVGMVMMVVMVVMMPSVIRTSSCLY